MTRNIPYKEWEKIRNEIRSKFDRDWDEYLDLLIEEQKDKKRKFAFDEKDKLVEVRR